MRVRFREDHLETLEGEVLDFSPEYLKQICLKGDIQTTSTYEIIANAIKRELNLEICGITYRKSSLFNDLEDDIIKDRRYKTYREEALKKINKKEPYNPLKKVYQEYVNESQMRLVQKQKNHKRS